MVSGSPGTDEESVATAASCIADREAEAVLPLRWPPSLLTRGVC